MSVTLKRDFHVFRHEKGRKRMEPGELPTVGHGVPRVAKLLALAIRFDQLVSDGVVANYAELARLGYVSRARLTQIMNLLHLAPDIQEEILFLPPGHAGLREKQVRRVAAETNWRKQRRMWRDQSKLQQCGRQP